MFSVTYTNTWKNPRVLGGHTTLAKVSSRPRARCQDPPTPNCGRRHRLRTHDAARDAAARGRMIDRRGSVVKAEPDEECLLQRGMTTSRKCVSQPVPFRRPSRLAAATRTYF